MKGFKASILRLARADIVFWVLPPLMLLLIAGTIAQKWMGLYAAHKMFFASFIFFVGPVPLPGGYLLIGFLSFFLAIKFIFASLWSWHKAGIILTHLGVLVLLIGGFATALSARERYMILAEGQETPFIYDYVARELVIFKNNQAHKKINFKDLKTAGFDLPFDLKVKSICQNCKIIKRAEKPDEFGDLRLQGMARFMALEPASPGIEPEADISGLIFEIQNAKNPDHDGIYLAIEGMPAPIEIKQGKDIYAIIFGKAQKQLPFSIALEDFKKDSYPGTDKARAYSSRVTIRDDGVEWPALIEMNKPLRYKGYTFFQSSFEQEGGQERSILSVVENQGRLLPYIGTVILALGLALHIFILLRSKDSGEKT